MDSKMQAKNVHFLINKYVKLNIIIYKCINVFLCIFVVIMLRTQPHL